MEAHYRSAFSSEKNVVVLDFHVLTQLFSIKNIKYPEKKKKKKRQIEKKLPEWRAAASMIAIVSMLPVYKLNLKCFFLYLLGYNLI